MSLANILFLHDKLENSSSEDNETTDKLAKDLRQEECKFLEQPATGKDDVINLADFGLYLCASDRLDKDVFSVIFQKIRTCLS